MPLRCLWPTGDSATLCYKDTLKDVTRSLVNENWSRNDRLSRTPLQFTLILIISNTTHTLTSHLNFYGRAVLVLNHTPMYSSHNRGKYSCLNKNLVEVYHITTSLYGVVKSCPFYSVVAARMFIITSGLFSRVLAKSFACTYGGRRPE